jgi:RNA polymerase sigma factor (sigma-70 family)
MDLYQEGYMGLLSALKKFNPDKARFATYAPWWIYQNMNKFCVKMHTSVHLPNNLRLSLNRLISLENSTSRHLSTEEIAKEFEISEDKVRILQNLKQKKSTISLDSDINSSSCKNPLKLGDTLKDDRDTPDTLLLRKIQSEEFKKSFHKFKETSQKNTVLAEILMLRFDEELKYKEIGEIYGFSIQRAQQLVKTARKKFIEYFRENSEYGSEC